GIFLNRANSDGAQRSPAPIGGWLVIPKLPHPQAVSTPLSQTSLLISRARKQGCSPVTAPVADSSIPQFGARRPVPTRGIATDRQCASPVCGPAGPSAVGSLGESSGALPLRLPSAAVQKLCQIP